MSRRLVGLVHAILRSPSWTVRAIPDSAFMAGTAAMLSHHMVQSEDHASHQTPTRSRPTTRP